MILTETVLKAINNPRVRIKLATAMECTEQTIIRYITANKKNGPLTTAAALTVIEEETGYAYSDILEQENAIA